MRLQALAARYLALLDPGAMNGDLADVTRFDRLQGSVGLGRAAEFVAERAESAGLTVDLCHFPPGSSGPWWSFAVPAARSPLRASLGVAGADGRITELVGYPGQPYCLARGSGSTRPVNVQLLDADRHGYRPMRPGAFVLLPHRRAAELDGVLAELTAAQAVGFALESAPSGDPSTVDRLEVPDGTVPVAFSISVDQADALRDAAARGRAVRIEAHHEPAVAMPVVYGEATSGPGPAALLVAHLCHPAPGANDNASGVVALLAIARAVRDRAAGTPPNIAFLWAPEIVGTAAYLHDVHGSPARLRPNFAVSLDMVGSTDAPCVFEGPPDHVAAPLSGALEAAARAVVPPARSYSGAVEVPAWRWVHTPFVGASDHLLFADRSVGLPAAQIGHWPDPYHHTSRDDLSRVSAEEIRRVGATVLTATHLQLRGGTAVAEVAKSVFRLVAADLVDVSCRAAVAGVRRGIVSAYDPEHAAGTLTAIADTACASLDRLQADHSVIRPQVAALKRQLRTVAAALAATVPPASPPAGGPALQRRWDGPWNLRGFGRSLSPSGRSELRSLGSAGRSAYAWMTATALAIDGSATRDDVMARAARATRLDLVRADVHRFIDLLCEARWAGEDGPEES